MTLATRSLTKLARMRIIALPLTSEASALSGQHTYYNFQTPPPIESKGKPSLLKRATGKASKIWAGFGEAPEGTWKYRTFKYGERVMDRIEFEELALKSMDPSLGPKITRPGEPGLQLEQENDASISLIHPTFYASKISPLRHLQSLLEKRTPTHRKGFYFWMLISPLTAPFMLIPIIPNLPFFFCVWRSWHHYRAYKASYYLESLLEKGAIKPEANVALDRIYEKYHPSFRLTSSSSPGSSQRSGQAAEEDKEEELLLSREAVPKLVSLFELPSSAESDLLRALDQTRTRLKRDQT